MKRLDLNFIEGGQKFNPYAKKEAEASFPGGYQQVTEADIAVHICPDAHFLLSATEIGMAAFIAFHRHIQTFQLFYRIAHFLLHRAENFIEIRKNHILSEILFVFSISSFGAIYVIF